jgi:diacylglycerol O-acyltransferase / wax synthase
MSPVRRHSQRFSPADAVSLRTDDPTNMTMITGVMTFDGILDVERLRATLETRLLAPYRRFRQRARRPGLIGLPRWEDDPHFDLDAHVHRAELPAPGDQAALQVLVSELMSTPLDYSRPLWQVHVVEECAGGSALVVRLHHCIADGLALVQVLLSLADAAPDAPPPAPAAAPPEEDAGGIRDSALAGYRMVRGGMHLVRKALHEGRETLGDRERLADASWLAAAGTFSLGKLILTPPDGKTIFRGPVGVPKLAAWSEPIPLADVKAIGRAVNGTVNDVLLAVLAGALRRYAEERGQATGGLNIRALVPVNVRGPDDLSRLGNRFGIVFLDLPVGVRNPGRRLLVLKRRMDEIKDSPDASVTFGVLNVLGLAPTSIEKRLGAFLADKTSAIVTNVPGPREQLYLAGSPLRSFMFWVPTPAGLGLGISILSYRGEVTVGVATDAGLIPDPEAIVAAFLAEVEEMKAWAAQGDGQDSLDP